MKRSTVKQSVKMTKRNIELNSYRSDRVPVIGKTNKELKNKKKK